jgi:hypothetical protein
VKLCCECCGKRIPDKVILEYAASLSGARSAAASLMGQAGGKNKARDPEKMRAASLKRWEGRRKSDQAAV